MGINITKLCKSIARRFGYELELIPLTSIRNDENQSQCNIISGGG